MLQAHKLENPVFHMPCLEGAIVARERRTYGYPEEDTIHFVPRHVRYAALSKGPVLASMSNNKIM